MFELFAAVTLDTIFTIAVEAVVATVAAKAASDIYDAAFHDEDDD